MKPLDLDDRIDLFEYRNKKVRWLINADHRAVELAWKDKHILLNKVALKYLRDRKKRPKRQYIENYYVNPQIIMEALARS